ncbi:hypothetical protein DFP72DRAFT_861622 [Ephemerocybe angulata]|uniref:Uncharacterized protein n=1 Tax=Ephemerocybe angulata TaxID=980116 RepID=A0A8H6H9G1_9AGAR|nr:hypothetical protein DFP72DRAFT_861622 [Tulosesus angulatus]
MGVTWCSPPETVFLAGKIPGFLQSQIDEEVDTFLVSVYQEFFVISPLPEDRTEQDIRDAKARIKRWFAWHSGKGQGSRNRSLRKAIDVKIKNAKKAGKGRKRAPQRVEVYTKRNEAFLHLELRREWQARAAELGIRTLDSKERLATQRRVTTQLMNQASQEEQDGIDADIRAWKAERAAEEARAEAAAENPSENIDGNSGDLEMQEEAIQLLPQGLGEDIEAWAAACGWVISVMACGPRPTAGGALALQVIYAGPNSLVTDENFQRSYADFKQGVEAPFVAHVADCFGHVENPLPDSASGPRSFHVPGRVDNPLPGSAPGPGSPTNLEGGGDSPPAHPQGASVPGIVAVPPPGNNIPPIGTVTTPAPLDQSLHIGDDTMEYRPKSPSPVATPSPGPYHYLKDIDPRLWPAGVTSAMVNLLPAQPFVDPRTCDVPPPDAIANPLPVNPFDDIDDIDTIIADFTLPHSAVRSTSPSDNLDDINAIVDGFAAAMVVTEEEAQDYPVQPLLGDEKERKVDDAPPKPEGAATKRKGEGEERMLEVKEAAHGIEATPNPDDRGRRTSKRSRKSANFGPQILTTGEAIERAKPSWTMVPVGSDDDGEGV